MPDLRPGAAKIADLFGSIQTAVSQRMSTADVWRHLRDAAASAGRDLTGVNAVDVGQLRSIGAGLRDATAAFALGAMGSPIPSSAIAQNIYSRSMMAQSLAPAYHIRFTMGLVVNGVADTRQYTYVLPGMLPQTKGELVDSLSAYGQALAEQGSSRIDPGAEFVDIGNIEISAV